METGCDLDHAVTNLVNRYTVSVTYKVPNEYDSLVTIRPVLRGGSLAGLSITSVLIIYSITKCYYKK